MIQITTTKSTTVDLGSNRRRLFPADWKGDVPASIRDQLLGEGALKNAKKTSKATDESDG